MSCGDSTRIIQVNNGGGSGGSTSSVTYNGDGTYTHNNGSGVLTVINTNVLEGIIDADGDSSVSIIENGGQLGGDMITFDVDGTQVGNVEILAGGIIKWTLNGILDPTVYRPTGIDTATRDSVYTPIAQPGDLIYNTDLPGYEKRSHDNMTWEPFGGSSGGMDTFATLSGTVLTLADGQTIDLQHTVDTDTFATLSGNTLTLADGQTVDLTQTTDTDTFATLSGNTLTLADGQTVDLQHTVDTDTFATISGTVLTLADGSTFNLSSTDTKATISGSVITFADGQTADLSAIDTDTDTFATLAGTTLTLADGQTIAIVDTDTFATLAGTVLTLADGSTIDIASVDTDTFATLSGSVITFADGQTVNVSGGGADTFATFSGSVITFPDGQTTDLSAIDTNTFATLSGTTLTLADGQTIAIVDTDTFATLAGTVLTLADGSTIDIASVDTDTFATLSGSVITFADGQTVDVASTDTNTFATLSGTVITFADNQTITVIDSATYTTEQAAQDSAIALNTAKVSADASVTSHSDVTDAGSGQIITAAERLLLHADDDVETVTGNLVNNTDPRNPVISGVASLSGTGVDNTDASNPIVNIPEVSCDVITSPDLIGDIASNSDNSELLNININGTPVTLIDLVDATASGNNLTFGTSGGWGAKGAATAESLSGDGYIEATLGLNPGGNSRIIGLSVTNVDADRNTINYGIHARGSGGTTIRIVENGNNIDLSDVWAQGDILRVQRDGTVITYYNNGNLLHTSTVPSGSSTTVTKTVVERLEDLCSIDADVADHNTRITALENSGGGGLDPDIGAIARISNSNTNQQFQPGNVSWSDVNYGNTDENTFGSSVTVNSDSYTINTSGNYRVTMGQYVKTVSGSNEMQNLWAIDVNGIRVVHSLSSTSIANTRNIEEAASMSSVDLVLSTGDEVKGIFRREGSDGGSLNAQGIGVMSLSITRIK